MGSIDCLALTLKSAIQVLGNNLVGSIHATQLFEPLTSLVSNSQAPEAQRICAANVFTTCTKYLSLSEAGVFARLVMWPLVKMANNRDAGLSSAAIQCACMQAMMHICFKLGKSIHPYSYDVLQLIHSALLTKSLQTPTSVHSNDIRLSALKLLSSVIAAREEIAVEHGSLFASIQKELMSLANLDTNAQVRQIAQQLVQMMVPQ